MANSKTRADRIISRQLSHCTVEAAHLSAVGIDVHHDQLICCFQKLDPIAGELTSEHRSFGTTIPQLLEFAAWCRVRESSVILMESTGALWFSPYRSLEDVGFDNDTLALVNARDVKAAVGRKTDAQDAKRLAEYARLGKFHKSFVPSRPFRDMRMVSRDIIRLSDDISRQKNRYNKNLNSVGCRATSVFSDVHGKAAGKILDAYIRGDRDFEEIVRSARKQLRATQQEILEAINFAMSDALRELLRSSYEHLQYLIARRDSQIALLERMQAPYQEYIDRLMTIPGVKELSARLLFCEFTNEQQSFPDAAHFASWLGLCPGNNKSAGKSSSGKTPKGNRWARKTLTEVAHGIGLMKRGALKALFQAFKERRGARRAVVAIAHKVAMIMFAMIWDGSEYVETTCSALRDTRVKRLLQTSKNLREQRTVITLSGQIVDKDTGELIGQLSVDAAT